MTPLLIDSGINGSYCFLRPEEKNLKLPRLLKSPRAYNISSQALKIIRTMEYAYCDGTRLGYGC